MSDGRILVVDDQEMNRDLLCRRLGKQGFEVDTACNGAVALKMLGEKKYDLVLLDIMMPEKNGYEVLAEMKSQPDWIPIPVIMISALGEMDGIAKCIEMGAEDYLPKPFKSVLLKARVSACLEKKRLHDQQERWTIQLEQEKRRADDLLKVILPAPIIEELKQNDGVKSRRYENVAVLFSDIVDFTSYCEVNTPEQVVDQLQKQVIAFEELTVKHGIQKIKTIGDAFMGTAGLLSELDNPVLACVQCGAEMVATTAEINPDWSLRVGVHIGPVIGGVVGKQQYLFDIWGDTVNTAARIQEAAGSNTIAVSQEAWNSISGLCEGTQKSIDVKGKGFLSIVEITSTQESPQSAHQGSN